MFKLKKKSNTLIKCIFIIIWYLCNRIWNKKINIKFSAHDAFLG